MDAGHQYTHCRLAGQTPRDTSLWYRAMLPMCGARWLLFPPTYLGDLMHITAQTKAKLGTDLSAQREEAQRLIGTCTMV